MVDKFSDERLLNDIPRGDLRAVSRFITLIENGSSRAAAIQAQLFRNTGKASVIGITGSPGAGKSTLVDSLAVLLRKAGKRVAILAIDPTSPFTGGAILGDRIRMNKTLEDKEVFIRSMATRGALGGISRATVDVVQVLDAAGFDTVIIETVGVGQAEVDIVRTADTCVVVLVPGMGDGVQAMKAGILEIADVFVVNKADREGADHLIKDLRVLLSLNDHSENDWNPQIVSTVATRGEGAEELVSRIGEHGVWLAQTDAGRLRKREILKQLIMKVAYGMFGEELLTVSPEAVDGAVEQCLLRATDPYTVAQSLVREAAKNLLTKGP